MNNEMNERVLTNNSKFQEGMEMNNEMNERSLTETELEMITSAISSPLVPIIVGVVARLIVVKKVKEFRDSHYNKVMDDLTMIKITDCDSLKDAALKVFNEYNHAVNLRDVRRAYYELNDLAYLASFEDKDPECRLVTVVDDRKEKE